MSREPMREMGDAAKIAPERPNGITALGQVLNVSIRIKASAELANHSLALCVCLESAGSNMMTLLRDGRTLEREHQKFWKANHRH